MDEAPASEDTSPASVHVTHNLSWKWPRYGACNFVATSGVAAEPHNAVEEAIPAQASPTEEPYTIAPEEDPLPEYTLPAEEKITGRYLLGGIEEAAFGLGLEGKVGRQEPLQIDKPPNLTSFFSS